MMRIERVKGVVAAAVLALVGSGLVSGVPASASASTPTAAPESRATAGSCAGFKNRVGITDKYVTISTIADLTGPAPQLNRSALQAVRAYVASFNRTSSICGRKLRLLGLDSRMDSAVDRTATITACQKSFASIGSMSVQDDGGAARAQLCGLPDLRAKFHTPQRLDCSTCFATQVDEITAYENAVPDYLLERYPSASQSSAMVYLNAKPWYYSETAFIAESMRGMNFVHAAGIDFAEFDYGPYVQQMKAKAVTLVQAFLPWQQLTRLAEAMAAGAFTPTAFVLDPDAYGHVTAPAFEGAIVPVNFVPFEDGKNEELIRYRHWLNKVAPGAKPTPAGLFAWSAARLFTQQAKALGGRLNRPNLVNALRAVHGWRGLGMHAAQDVGGKKNGNCWRFLRRSGKTWVPVGGTSYRCSGKTVLAGPD